MAANKPKHHSDVQSSQEKRQCPGKGGTKDTTLLFGRVPRAAAARVFGARAQRRCRGRDSGRFSGAEAKLQHKAESRNCLRHTCTG